MALRLTSGGIGWLAGERRRRNGWRGLAVSGFVALASWALMVPLDAKALMGLSVLAVLAAIASAIVIARSSSTRGHGIPGEVLVEDGAIVVRTAGDQTRTPLSEVVDGWIEHPSDVRLRLTDGRVLAVSTPGVESAEALLAAAGTSASQRVVSVPLSSTASQTPWGVAASVVGITLLTPAILFTATVVSIGVSKVLMAPTSADVIAVLILAGVFAALAGGLAVLVAGLRRRAVVVGADGITLEQGRRKTFVPYARIQRVDADARGVRVQRHDGGAVLLPTWRHGEPPLATVPEAGPTTDPEIRQRVLLGRIERAARASRRTSADLEALDRRGRTLSQWRSDVQVLARARADYRTAALGSTDLADVVEDVTASPERRIAAAMGLGASEDAEARQRVRVVLATCADEELKAALEQAAEAEADEEPILRVLARR